VLEMRTVIRSGGWYACKLRKGFEYIAEDKRHERCDGAGNYGENESREKDEVEVAPRQEGEK
jgi:hypothetical protein